jgi:hypothetical protein
MAVSKDFRVKKGLIVGQNIDATSGNLSAVDIDASGTFTAGSFEPATLTATISVSSPSISADNIWGNIKDVTYSELSITGGLSSDGVNLTNATGDIGLGTLDAVSATVTNGASAAIFTIPTSQYRSGKIVVQAVAVQGTPSAMETTEILYVQGLSTINWIEYATVGIGSEAFVTYTGVINGGNVEFRANNEYSVPLNFVSSISQLYAIT